MKYAVLSALVLLAILSLASAQRLTHAEALARIRGAGIGISSSGGCSDRNNRRCTSLETIRVQTINGVITLRNGSGCPITVTGGTETGHAGGPNSHWNGYKVDIALNSCIDGYITRNFAYIGRRSDGAAQYRSAAGNIYAREGNHWDITYFKLIGILGPNVLTYYFTAFAAVGVPLFFYREFPAWQLIPYCWGMAILLGILFYPFESLASRGGYFAPVRIFWINGIFLLGASVFPFFQVPTIFVGMVVAFAGILYIIAAARGEKVIVPPAARGPPPAAPRKPQDDRPVSERLNAYLVNEGIALLVVILFMIANGAVFTERFLYYLRVRQDFFPILGYGLTIARACGAGLKLTGSVILITMCRNFLSRVRETFVGTYLPVLDKHIEWHKAIAWMIAIYATAHTMAHAVNFQNLSLLDLETLKAVNVATPDMTERPTLVRLWWGTIPGFTGHVILTCMVLMYTTAVSSVRRHKKMFELFWFTHHLFTVFFAALCIHGAQGVLEPANFWMWWAGPALLYLMERITRGVRKNQDTIILQAIAHKSQVLELRMRKANLQWRPGQYVFLNCPYVASNEWHPFTISSSPDENFLSVHIKRAGDWTGALHDLINPEKKMDGSIVRENLVLDPSGKPIISIDGPFGAASEDVFKFENVVLSAAGIGITPMASILKSIRYQIQNHPESCPIRQVNFYWSNQDVESFEWILQLLGELEETCPFLTSQLFVTRMAGDEAEIIRNIIHAETQGVDAFLGLKRTRLNRTRPNFDKIFKESAENEFKDQEVGVFFCGAPAVANDIYKACIKHSKKRTKFIFHKENF